MIKLDKLMRFANGDNRDYAPMSPIWLLVRTRVKCERLMRLANGDNKD